MRDSITFVHAADLHLDAPFQGVSADNARVGAALADATYDAFRRVIDIALERDVDFVVIAGDVYNSAERSLRAQLRFTREIERLSKAGIEVFVAHGNHDPSSGWSAGLSLPENVHVFSPDAVERFEVRREGEVVAAVYGQSYRTQAVTENLSLGYRRLAEDPLAVAVLHGNVGGNPDYDPYAPASLDDLRAARMDYWALGHIHKQEILSTQPWMGYCGSPQGLNVKEIGGHGCFVAEVSRSGLVRAEHVETAPIGWAQSSIQAEQADDLETIRRKVSEECERIREREGRPCIVRFTLSGRTKAHSALARGGVQRQMLDDVRDEQMSMEPWLWVERLDDRTSSAIDLDAVRTGPDFSAEIVAIADALLADTAQADALLANVAAPLRDSLSGYDESLDAGEAIAAARDMVLDLLLPTESEGQ